MPASTLCANPSGGTCGRWCSRTAAVVVVLAWVPPVPWLALMVLMALMVLLVLLVLKVLVLLAREVWAHDRQRWPRLGRSRRVAWWYVLDHCLAGWW